MTAPGGRPLLVSVAAIEKDPELRVEDAARLFASPRDAWVTDDWRRARRRDPPGEEPVEDVMARRPVVYGRLPAGLRDAWVPPAERLADRYPVLAAFAVHAGRDVVAVSHAERHSALVDAVYGRFAVGDEVVRVKIVARPKYGMYLVARPAVLSRDAVRDALWAELGYALEHLCDLPDAFLVQQEVPMRYEYRLFVVAGRPVAGAGCVDRHTPLNCRAAPFDDAVEEVRGNRRVRTVPGVVEGLVRFGTRVAAQVAAEEPRLSEYTLDVAVGHDGRPLVVEMNGLRNSGLYACDPAPVVAALIDAG